MSKYYDRIYGLLELLKDRISKAIPSFKEVSYSVRTNDKDYQFPRLEILIEREELSDEIIGDDYNLCLVTIRLIPFVKSFKKEYGTQEILKLTGELYDLIYKIRKEERHALFDDLYVDTIENYYFIGENYVLYSASLIIKAELRIWFIKKEKEVI